MNQSQSPKEALKALTDYEIIAIRKGLVEAYPLESWGITLALARAIEAEVLSRIDQLGVPAEGHEEVGLFSVGVDGSLCFHKAVRDAQRLTSTLNRTVTGGPYKARVAYAGPLITAAPKERA